MDKMKESTGAICIRENFPETELSFAEILLDERLLNSDIWISKKALSAVGGITSCLFGFPKNTGFICLGRKMERIFYIKRTPLAPGYGCLLQYLDGNNLLRDKPMKMI